jgi:hypothetical protein
MKCPECVAANQTSRINIGHSTRPAKCGVAYYDETGTYHPAATPPTTTRYECSNGHTWKVTA